MKWFVFWVFGGSIAVFWGRSGLPLALIGFAGFISGIALMDLIEKVYEND